jgi:glyoxylase-like metal-dependent hydrolase (beta-lactamase superfamily II)
MSALRLERASDHVWWFTPDERTDRPALGAVSGSEATVLLDVGASPGHTASFLSALAPLDLPPLRAAVLTHWHWDHSFGGAALDVPILAHRETATEVAHQASLDWSDEALAGRVAAGEEIPFCAEMIPLELPDRSALEIVVPQIVFDERLELRLGGVTCHVEHVGGDHATDSVVIHVVEDDLLFLGDCLYQRLYADEPHLTIAGLRTLVRRIRAFGARRAIEGHGDAVRDAASLAAWLDELEGAADLVERDGPTALAGARTEDERELVGFLVAGLAAR